MDPDPGSGRVIALVGLRCVGKSSVGRELARLGGATFVDLDEALAAGADPGPGPREGAAPDAGELLLRLGQSRFRELELATLERLLEHPAEGPRVLATGGGCVETPAALEFLRERTLGIWLREEVRLLAGRLAADPRPRPSLTGAEPGAELEQLARRREALYRAVARITIDCRGEGIEAIARRVLARLPAGWREPGA